ncbi:MAG: hypothetical protein K1X71_08350 [Pirellulales bacterium]|nr:hypothetical protein [Pirellulales bacterium]
MQPQRSSLVTEYRLQSRFEELRDRLLGSPRQERLQQPLAYWTLPHDRRLPLAFMSRNLHELLNTPFDALIATPGVGQKKMVALVHLLERAESNLDGESGTYPIDEALAALDSELSADSTVEAGFAADRVSESAWSLWRDSVKRYHLEEETLGRFAPSLERLPRVLWHTTLNAYCDLSLGEIRGLKTHGEKRVAAVLEVFHELYALLSGLGTMSHLAIRLQPRLAGQVENWLLAALERSEPPCPAELDRQLLTPLAAQVRGDLGELVGDLVDDRLGLSGHEASVREKAAALGLTRARLYQLLADAAEVIAVRWPEGQYLAQHLAGKLRSQGADLGEYERFFAAVDLFFPSRHVNGTAPPSQGDATRPDGHQRRAG